MNIEIFRILDDTIRKRRSEPALNSYTRSLFDAGENKIIKKLGEENAEFIRAFLTQTHEEMAGEAADYIYHMLVALRYKGIGLEEVIKVLEERHK